jgi:MinD-like ATPase involved in chromosome partitioning or flagellar assembly
VLIVVVVIVLRGLLMLEAVLILSFGLVLTAFPQVMQSVLPERFSRIGPVPNSGIRRWLWKSIGSWLYSRFGWEWLAHRSLAEREFLADNWLWDNRHIQKIVAFFNSKGGSAKTAFCVWLAAIYTTVIKRHIIALDADENTGHTASRFGIARKTDALKAGTPREGTVELPDYIDLIKRGRVQTPAEFDEVIGCWDRASGVSLIASREAANQRLALDDIVLAITRSKELAHCVFVDQGTGILHDPNVGSAIMTDTHVYVGNAKMADSVEDIPPTRKQYTDFGLQQKVNKSVIVIVGTTRRQRRRIIEQYGFPPGQVFFVPNDPYMKQGGEKPVNIKKLRRRTRVVLKEILVAIIEAEFVSEQMSRDELLAKQRRKGKPHYRAGSGAAGTEALQLVHPVSAGNKS